MLSGPLEIVAVVWAGFTRIFLLLELTLGTCSPQRESNLLSIYLLACLGRVIKHSISRVVLFFPFADFALFFENWIPLQVKAKEQNSLYCAWGVVKNRKILFMNLIAKFPSSPQQPGYMEVAIASSVLPCWDKAVCTKAMPEAMPAV